MSVWTLALDGSHDAIRLGQRKDEVLAHAGTPTDEQRDSGRLAIVKYGPVELHFQQDELLFIVHCEFGMPPLPPAVESEALQLSPGPLKWPIDEAAVRAGAETVGIAVQEGTQFGMRSLRFGLATLLIHDDDGLAAWSVVRPVE